MSLVQLPLSTWDCWLTCMPVLMSWPQCHAGGYQGDSAPSSFIVSVLVKPGVCSMQSVRGLQRPLLRPGNHAGGHRGDHVGNQVPVAMPGHDTECQVGN